MFSGLRWTPGGDGLLYWTKEPPAGDAPQPDVWRAYRVRPPWSDSTAEPLKCARLWWPPDFSPDGQQVAYWGSMSADQGFGGEPVLVVEAVDGSSRRELPSAERPAFRDRSTCSGIAWSSDGRKVLLRLLQHPGPVPTFAFVVDVPSGTYHHLPSALGGYHADELAQGLPRREVVFGTWLPNTHRLLLALQNPPGGSDIRGPWPEPPPERSCALYDADTGEAWPVEGLAEFPNMPEPPYLGGCSAIWCGADTLAFAGYPFITRLTGVPASGR
jgi:hypothetical protein